MSMMSAMRLSFAMKSPPALTRKHSYRLAAHSASVKYWKERVDGPHQALLLRRNVCSGRGVRCYLRCAYFTSDCHQMPRKHGMVRRSGAESLQSPDRSHSTIHRRMKEHGETVKCYRCDAVYTPSDNWWRGYNLLGDTSSHSFIPRSRIPREHCPICNEPPQLEPSPQRGVM